MKRRFSHAKKRKEENSLSLLAPVINLSAKNPTLPRFSQYGVCALESRHVSGFRMPPSKYDFSEVMFVLDGRGWVIHGKIRHPIEKNHLIIVPRGSVYHYEDSPEAPLAMWALCIRPPQTMKNIFDPVLPSRFAVLRMTAFCRDAASDLRAILYEQSQMRHSSASTVVGRTLLLLDKIAHRIHQPEKVDKSDAREIEALIRVRDYIEKLEHAFHESETLETASHRLGISPRSLTMHFRHITGMSRQQYIQDLRLRHACLLLADSDQSITSIAFACGFEDLSNFFRVFRSEKKLSPSQWRQKTQIRPPM